MILNETYTLSNGIKIPKLGLGTWFIDDDKAAEAVHRAVELGYRLIDTAQAYGNERGVGEGLRTCGVDRSELFVASKVEAYSPIAHGEALKNPAIAKMAEKYGVSAAQLCIRYVIQLGTVAFPKTADPDHMKSNAHVDFVISDEDMKLLTNVEHISDYGDFNMFPVFSGKPLA